jgi:hypothetical protein
MKRVSLRMTLTLSTFLVSISLTAFWAFEYPSKVVIASPILAASNSTIEYHQINQLNKPETNENDIDVEYAWSLMGVDSLDGHFYVTNNTDETIRYLANNFGQSNPFWIKQNGKTKRVNQPHLVGIDAAKEQELKPNESTIFLIPVPQNDKPFEAGFNFLVGTKEKIVWVKVEKQLKSYGLACNKEIMKAGGVLAKTCISK